MALKLHPTCLGSGIAVSRQVHLALFYEARLDPAVMRERPRNHWLHRRFAKLAERMRLHMHRTSKAQEYRDHAEDCRRQAEHWGKMAAGWLRMAREVDWRE